MHATLPIYDLYAYEVTKKFFGLFSIFVLQLLFVLKFCASRIEMGGVAEIIYRPLFRHGKTHYAVSCSSHELFSLFLSYLFIPFLLVVRVVRERSDVEKKNNCSIAPEVWQTKMESYSSNVQPKGKRLPSTMHICRFEKLPLCVIFNYYSKIILSNFAFIDPLLCSVRLFLVFECAAH